VNWAKEHMPFTRDENPARFQMCCNFMNAVLKSDYKTLQSQHERYKSDYAAYEEATKHSSQEVVEISGSYSGEMLTKKQYRNRSQFDPTTIKLVNASATVAGSTEVSMFNKVSVNDFQRFGEKGMENSDTDLVNLTTRLRTMWDYQPKDKTTDPDHERGLNYVCTGLRQLWVALSKRTTSNIHSLVEYNTKMPFGVDPVDEFCIGNYFHKLDWQPFGQEDCPRLVQNRPPSIGGPPIDYMLDWCWMTQCWDTRDMMKCPMHPYGCGKSLTREQTVIIWGEDCQRVRGNVLYTGVWMLDHNLTICCKVGVVKMVPYQTEYFHNRVGIVSEIYAPDDVSTEARDAVGKVIESRKIELDKKWKEKEDREKLAKEDGSTVMVDDGDEEEDDKKMTEANKPNKDIPFQKAVNGSAIILFTDGVVRFRALGDDVSSNPTKKAPKKKQAKKKKDGEARDEDMGGGQARKRAKMGSK